MRKPLQILGIAVLIFLTGSWNAGISQGKDIEIPPLKPLKTVIPSYPDELREERISGEVAICAMIDAKGKIQWALVARPLHPELDKLALESVKRWTFEPYMHLGNPISVPTYIAIRFSPPSAPPRPKAKDIIMAAPADDELRGLLVRCADYCRKLSEAALFYTCREAVSDSEKEIEVETLVFNWTSLADGSVETAKYACPALKSGKTLKHSDDYQLINKNGRIEERRTPLDENGESANPEGRSPAPIRAFFAKPILAPVRLLGREQQASFVFRRVDEGKIGGRKVAVLEAKPKPGSDEDIREGRIWADPRNGQILRVVMTTRSVEGCEWILGECAEHALTPHFALRHDFGFEKNGVLFPSRSQIRVVYSGLAQPPKDTKADVDIRYENYRFFTVETENAIIR